MIRLMLLVVLPSFGENGEARRRLALELLAMRQQLAAYHLTRPRPRLNRGFKSFWMLFRRVWPYWKDLCVLVKPETVIRWHRVGFRLFWRWKSRNLKPGRPLASPDLRSLIRRMALENLTWGAPRIHGELRKLGLTVSERTVLRHMPKRGSTGEDRMKRRQSWRSFLENHREVIAAMDFLVIPTWNFRPLYLLVILDHGRRVVRHLNITAHPTAAWVKQQLREAFPFEKTPKYLIFDQDTIFGAVKTFVQTMGIQPKLTAYHAPWQNGACERLHGSLRRELFDHVIVLDEAHARRLIKEYLRYYHEDRTHLGLNKDSPRGRPLESKPGEHARVEALPCCGGLHHRYHWHNAA